MGQDEVRLSDINGDIQWGKTRVVYQCVTEKYINTERHIRNQQARAVCNPGMEKNQLNHSSRTIAFAAIVFTIVNITACLLVFPLVFHYVQTLQANVPTDFDFCKV